MSVIMTMRVSGDPAKFEETVAAQADAIGRIMDVAQRNGLIAHRWYGSDGEFMAVDEWPDQQSFQAFMEQAQPDIGPVMEAAGVTSQPSVTFWRTLDTGDASAGEPERAALRRGRDAGRPYRSPESWAGDVSMLLIAHCDTPRFTLEAVEAKAARLVGQLQRPPRVPLRSNLGQWRAPS
jgi:hypothetical protein